MPFGNATATNIPSSTSLFSTWGGEASFDFQDTSPQVGGTYKKLPKLLKKVKPVELSGGNTLPANSTFIEMLPFPYMIPYLGCDMRPMHYEFYPQKESGNHSSLPPAAPFPAFYHPALHVVPPNASNSSAPGVFSSTETVTATASLDSPQFGPGPPIITGEKLKGPRGCNLFVFHLPNEITNWDLYLLFRRFGTIVSVHIMVNKTTGLSKGYGFVSFAFHEDAKSAIEAMDGFRLGKKRLKVQLKRLQDDNGEEISWEDCRPAVVQNFLELSGHSGTNSTDSSSSPRHNTGNSNNTEKSSRISTSSSTASIPPQKVYAESNSKVLKFLSKESANQCQTTSTSLRT